MSYYCGRAGLDFVKAETRREQARKTMLHNDAKISAKKTRMATMQRPQIGLGSHGSLPGVTYSAFAGKGSR